MPHQKAKGNYYKSFIHLRGKLLHFIIIIFFFWYVTLKLLFSSFQSFVFISKVNWSISRQVIVSELSETFFENLWKYLKRVKSSSQPVRNHKLGQTERIYRRSLICVSFVTVLKRLFHIRIEKVLSFFLEIFGGCFQSRTRKKLQRSDERPIWKLDKIPAFCFEKYWTKIIRQDVQLNGFYDFVVTLSSTVSWQI